MRKSSLYLGLSVIALVVGVALGEAKNLGFDCRVACPVVCDSHDMKFSTDELNRHYDEAFRMVQTGDFEAMEFHARRVLDVSNSAVAHELNAYALRGQGRHAESIAKYRDAIRLSEGSPYRDVVTGDSWIGIAANFAAMGETEEALEAATRAVEFAHERVRTERNDSAHYQLACAYATRSGIEGGTTSADSGAAFAHLNLAMSKGFDNLPHMRGDLDLKPLHGDKRFERLLN